MIRIIERLQRRVYRNYIGSYAGLGSVPFGLPSRVLPGRGPAVIDDGRIEGRSLIVVGCVMGVAALLLSSFLILGLATPSDGTPFWLCLLAAPFSTILGLLLVCGGLAMRSLRIVAFRQGEMIAIGNHSGDALTVWTAIPIAQCRLIVQPVDVNRGPLGTWRGFMMTLTQKGGCEMVLACLRTMEELENWTAAAPGWLADVSIEEAPAVRRRGNVHFRVGQRR